jgi:hypothetical protein
MMVVVPVNAHVYKAQDIAQEHRDQGCKSLEVLTPRHLQLENHDGDDDRNHGITEQFHAVLTHLKPLQSPISLS